MIRSALGNDTATSSSNQKRERLLDTLQRMLNDAPQQSEECCIYRVPEQLRRLNPTVYTPVAFPIGPIHNKDHGHDDNSEADHPELISNRLYKLKFLKSFFQMRQNNPQAFWDTVRRRITDIRKCYAYYDKIFEDDDIFADMILLDCIFIIQLFLEHQGSREESVLMAPLKVKEIASDLILAENQLPFFILQELYDQFEGDVHFIFEDIACRFLKIHRNRDANVGRPFHILDMMRKSLLPPWNLWGNDTYFPGTMLKRPYNDNGNGNDIDLQEIMYPTATSLFEAGIEFRVKDDPFSILDISFDVKKGILYIPKLRVDDGTERKFRNLIAFEQSHTKDNQPTISVFIDQMKSAHNMDPSFEELDYSIMRGNDSMPDPSKQKRAWESMTRNPLQAYRIVREYTYITDYLFFMDCLINTAKDVQLLTKAGIIENWLGCETNLSELINSMGIHAYHFTGGYLYSRIARELNRYHKKKWNQYKAILNQGYLGHPWAILGLCSAALLLLLTIAQVALAGVAL